MSPDLEAALARLFQAPLEGFVAERNGLAALLKKAGHKDDAARLKEVSKPPASAWAVNQLWWKQRPVFDALLGAGDRLRQAQQAGLAGQRAKLREALERRQGAVETAVEAAVAALGGASHVSLQVRQRIAANCDALAVGGWPGQTNPGCLTSDIAAPGLSALAGLSVAEPAVPEEHAPGPAPERGYQTSGHRAPPGADADADRASARAEEEARAAARQALVAAERELQSVDESLQRAMAASENAARDLERAAARVQELELELEHARVDASAADAAACARDNELARVRIDHEAATHRLSVAASAVDAFAE